MKRSTWGLLCVCAATCAANAETWLLVSDAAGNKIVRYSWPVVEPIDHFVGAGLVPNSGTQDEMAIGPDGALYVASFSSNTIRRFDRNTGQYLGVFVPNGSGGLNGPAGIAFGPDGHLYVASNVTGTIIKFNGNTGVPFPGPFVTAGSGGLSFPVGIKFGPDGDLYVASSGSDAVLRYNGDTGAFLGSAITSGQAGLDGPRGLLFDSFGNLFVSGGASNSIVRRSAATGVVTLWVSPGANGLLNPSRLAVTPSGTVLVAYQVDSVLAGSVLEYIGTDQPSASFVKVAVGAGLGGIGGDPHTILFVTTPDPCPGDADGDGDVDFDDLNLVLFNFATSCV